ncbi:MAG: glycosyltransferase family 2 protein [Pirellulales bacterium]|nr:glycosyltransferase family 2 protein [Pirellulales bacterium]
MSEKLTVLIPCRNEAHNIRACIESVRPLADEILVADSLSTDETTDVVRGLDGCRLIEREFVDHADFKNWAIPQASHPWILQIDADERLTDRLAVEIRDVLRRNDPGRDAYRLRFDNFFLGRPIRHCGWNRSSVIRLFRRDACRYGPARVHEKLEVDPGRVGLLQGRLLHYTCRSLAQWTEKQNRYTTYWAEDRRAAGRRAGWAAVLLRPPLRFLQLYILRGGFLDGAAGLIVCLGSMHYTFLKYAKLWQLSRDEN